jgi:MFS family permease
MTAVADQAPTARLDRGLVAVLSGNMLLDAIEVSVAIVALPAIARDLALAPSTAPLIVIGFALGFGAMLIPGRWAVARWGARPVYLVALAVFAAASAAGAAAHGLPLLIASRVVKGGCAALTAPTGLAIIAGTFPQGTARNRALTVYSSFGGWGLTAGLVLSGLTTAASWRLTFLLPAPAACALLAYGARVIPRPGPRSSPGPRTEPQTPGQLETRGQPGGSPPLAGRGAGTAPLVAGGPRLVRSALGAATLNGSLWGLLIACTFRLQDHLGWTPLAAGVALLPVSIPALAIAPAAPRLIARFGTARLIAAGAAVTLLGYLLTWDLAGRAARSFPGYAAWLLPGLLLVGAGFALCFSALHVQALSGVDRAAQGGASAVYQVAVQFGGVIVLAFTMVWPGAQLPVVITAGLLGLLIALAGSTREAHRQEQDQVI